MIEDDKEVIEGYTENGLKKMDKRKSTNRQTMIYKTPYRKLKIEQQKESYRKQEMDSGACPRILAQVRSLGDWLRCMPQEMGLGACLGTVSSINRP